MLAGGTLLIFHGMIRHDLPRSLGGACLAMTALTLIALGAIRRWVTDTSDERRILAATQREAQGRKDTYLAAQANLENEQSRLSRDMAAERANLAARLKAERQAMTEEFEERRAALIAETMEATVRMIQGGKMAPAQARTGNLIQFPEQHPARAGERERSREHGVVGP